MVDDLDTQRRAIVDHAAPRDAVEALDLLWRFLALANAIFARCDDSSGTVIAIFHQACADLGAIATAAKIPPERLADQAFQALNENDYGQYDELIAVLAPALGQEGLEHLKQRMIALSKTSVWRPANGDRQDPAARSMPTRSQNTPA